MKFLRSPYLNLSLLLLVIALLANSFFQGEKIAYVESNKLFNEYKASETAIKIYEEKSKTWQSNIDTLTTEVQAEMRKYEESIAGMSPKERAVAKQRIDGKRKELMQYQQSVQANAQQEYAKATQPIALKINDFLTRYGKEHHYTMILIANPSGTIAYAKEHLDITDDVLKEMNANYISEGKK